MGLRVSGKSGHEDENLLVTLILYMQECIFPGNTAKKETRYPVVPPCDTGHERGTLHPKGVILRT